MSDVTYVVIGAGSAGVRAVEALRGEGVDGHIIMIGEEAELPYQRPELSKGYLAGTKTRSDLSIHPEGWYSGNGVQLLLGHQAASIDPGSQTVRIDGAGRVGYDRLLIATGSRARRLNVPGEDLDGVLYLRRVADADAIRAAIAAGEPIVVVGGGWVGLEVASVARSLGTEVSLVEAAATPVAGMLGERVGARFGVLHRDHGVRICTRTAVRRLLGQGRVSAVELTDGSRLAAGTVIVSAGIEPCTELAVGAGLRVAGGVVVDSALRTSDPRIWAAGDLAVAHNSWAGVPLQIAQFASASEQGAFAGRSMAGAIESWGQPPSFWSSQYGSKIGYFGHADPRRDLLVVRDIADGIWAAFWLFEGRVRAGIRVNCVFGADELDRLVVNRARVDAGRLADPAVHWAETLVA